MTAPLPPPRLIGPAQLDGGLLAEARKIAPLAGVLLVGARNRTHSRVVLRYRDDAAGVPALDIARKAAANGETVAIVYQLGAALEADYDALHAAAAEGSP